MLRLLITGAGGRMGKMLIQTIALTPDYTLVAAITHKDSQDIDRDAGALAGILDMGIKVRSDLQAAITEADVVIDFTNPEVTMEVLTLCQSANCALVTGTTGFDSQQQKKLAAAGIPVLWAANFSVGANALFALARQAATMNKEADIEILELHHREKADSPSGTALQLGQVVAQALGYEFDQQARFGRHGITGPRESKTISFASLRAGDAIGEHTIMFGAPGERLEITHRASDRSAYARGALRAAVWLADQPPGIYNMQDVLGG